MDSRDRILGIVRQNGPVNPTQIARELRLESYVASAMLSELVQGKQLRISHFRVGSSPVYYLPEQDALLDKYLSSLDEKERRAALLLKEKKALRDSMLDPLTRVCLRNIKDFAIQLEVTLADQTEVFWRYHTVSQEETQAVIADILGFKEKKSEAKPIRTEKTMESVGLKVEKKEEQKKIEERLAEPAKVRLQSSQKGAAPAGDFERDILSYFNKNNIEVMQQNTVRKNNIEFTISLPSAVGALAYFCHAIDKLKVNEADLAAAYVKGENKKLPTLILTTGELTKAAKEALEKEFKKVVVKKL